MYIFLGIIFIVFIVSKSLKSYEPLNIQQFTHGYTNSVMLPFRRFSPDNLVLEPQTGLVQLKFTEQCPKAILDTYINVSP